MKIIGTIILDAEQRADIYRLWNNEYPVQLQYDSIAGLDNYLDALIAPMHYLALDDSGHLLGWAFTFEREGVTWFGIIIERSCQKAGIGTLLLSQLKSYATQLYGWVADHDRYTKSDGSVYHSPVMFYLKNGFELVDGIRLETEKLSLANICWRGDV